MWTPRVPSPLILFKVQSIISPKRDPLLVERSRAPHRNSDDSFLEFKTVMVISIQIKTTLINPVLRKQVESEKTHVFKSMEIHFLLIFYLSTSPVFRVCLVRFLTSGCSWVHAFFCSLDSQIFTWKGSCDLWALNDSWRETLRNITNYCKSWEPQVVNMYFYPNSCNRSTPNSFIFFSSEKCCLLCVTEVAREVDQKR